MNIGTHVGSMIKRAAVAGVISLVLGAALGGCSSYATPGRGADMSVFNAAQAQTADGTIREAYAAEPLAAFPAAVAVVRVQASGYKNYAGNSGYGSGR